MNNFQITINDDYTIIEGEEIAIGTIKVGAFKETFWAPMGYWSPSLYRQQWNHAMKYICVTQQPAALITRMYEPHNANFLEWWPLYYEGDSIFIRNSLFPVAHVIDFSLENLYSYLEPRSPLINEDGQKISEWSIAFSEFQQSYYRLFGYDETKR